MMTTVSVKWLIPILSNTEHLATMMMKRNQRFQITPIQLLLGNQFTLGSMALTHPHMLIGTNLIGAIGNTMTP